MRRTFDPEVRELMDLDQPVTPELERDLRNLVTLNRLFGSHTLVQEFLAPRLLLSRQSDSFARPWRILDLATASGDIPRMIAAWAHTHGIDVEIDAVDFQRSTLEIARGLSAAFPNIVYHEGDIRDFRLGSTRWDVVLCSLALHHFSQEDAVRVLRHAASLAERHVLAADLCRSTIGTLGVDLLTSVWMREPMTRHDARVSVRRAFSFEELANIARKAGWRDFRHAKKFCFRQALWMELS